MLNVIYRTRNEEKAQEVASEYGGVVREEMAYSVNDCFLCTMYVVEKEESEDE